MRLSVPNAAKLTWFLSNLQRANQLTVNHAFQNIGLGSQILSAVAMVLIPNKHGQDEDKSAGKTG